MTRNQRGRWLPDIVVQIVEDPLGGFGQPPESADSSGTINGLDVKRQALRKERKEPQKRERPRNIAQNCGEGVGRFSLSVRPLAAREPLDWAFKAGEFATFEDAEREADGV